MYLRCFVANLNMSWITRFFCYFFRLKTLLSITIVSKYYVPNVQMEKGLLCLVFSFLATIMLSCFSHSVLWSIQGYFLCKFRFVCFCLCLQELLDESNPENIPEMLYVFVCVNQSCTMWGIWRISRKCFGGQKTCCVTFVHRGIKWIGKSIKI